MTDNDIVKYFLKHRRVVASDEDIAWLKSVGDPQEIISNDYDLLNVEYWACIQNRLGVKISYQTAMLIDEALWNDGIDIMSIGD